jgi:D-alanyl-D-alanine carboxypeptidase
MSWLDVSSALAAIVVSTGVPGLVGMTLDARGCALAAGAAGVRRRGHAAPLRVDDRVHLGSCTKAMTATHVAALVRDGVLSWGDRPADAFAADCAVHPGWAGATLEALLQHRGGAPGVIDPSIWRDAWAARGPPRAARLELVRALLSRAPSSVPGCAPPSPPRRTRALEPPSAAPFLHHLALAFSSCVSHAAAALGRVRAWIRVCWSHTRAD